MLNLAYPNHLYEWITADTLPQNFVTFEDNCACPTDGMARQVALAQVQNDQNYQLARLHNESLDPEWELLFNPTNALGVVVVTRAAFQLLESFQQPQSLGFIAEQQNDKLQAREFLTRAVELGLLMLPNAVPIVPRIHSETLTAWLHVTNACNLRCPYCYIHKTADELDHETGLRAVQAVMRAATRSGFRRVKLKYAGGEATLALDTVIALHDHATLLAAHAGLELEGVVLSNGVISNSKMIQALAQRRIGLMISLDGVGEAHDQQRPYINGRGSFQAVERTLDRLAASALKPSISITLTQRNARQLADTVRYILARELPFMLNFYRESECSVSVPDLKLQEDTVIQAMEEAYEVIRQNLPRHSLLGALVDRARLDVPHSKPCGVGDSYLVINHRGGVAKCQMEIENTVTNIFANDILEVVRQDRKGIQNVSVEEKEGCRECTWRYWCAGGCPALTYRVTGRYDIKSPNCRIYKTLFPKALRLEGLRLLRYAM